MTRRTFRQAAIRNACRLVPAILLVQASLAASDPPAGGDAMKPSEKRWSMRDAVRALMLKEAKKSPPSATPDAKPSKDATAAIDDTPPPPGSVAAPSNAASQPPPPVILPQMEVRKGRITELDQQLAAQNKAIEREKKNLTPTEADHALNDVSIAKPLAVFGGESTQFRQRVAHERVELLEAEKDLLEAIAQARTKEEKDELQKQLSELRAFRRELDRTLR